MSERARIGITLGDPAGIGPEVVVAALRAGAQAEAAVEIFGDADALDAAGGAPPGIEIHPFSSARAIPGKPEPAAARGIVASIRAAARACLAGELDAMVTGPISKADLARGGFAYPGHTELLAELTTTSRPVMLLVGGALRVALATTHCPLREVPERLSRAGLREILTILARDLRERFGIVSPRIAVCGLNPHAGESGNFGDEEKRIIQPAVDDARGAGIDARGPFAADSLFHRAVQGEFDAVLGMYHDQALGPLKLHAFGKAVNVTLGLPLIRTSVDHGTAFDIAGKGSADSGSMVAAIQLAIELSRRQQGGRLP